MDPAKGSNKYSFAGFMLVPSERTLHHDGKPHAIGGRALDILIALVERGGALITKKELFDRVWGDITVDDSTLRFNIAELRKCLARKDADTRFIATVSGRGFCFVAPVTQIAAFPTVPPAPVSQEPVTVATLPPKLDRVVGRTETVADIIERMRTHRFVSVVGPGGMGKTTVAVAVAHELADSYDAVHFVDLSHLSGASAMPNALSSLFGLIGSPLDPIDTIVGYLRDKRFLLLLDSCEHIIDETAMLVERIYADAPNVGILTTSREVLRVEGEYVHRLAPLESPSEEMDLKAADAGAFPAVRLFLERMAATGGAAHITDQDAMMIASICRRLDGIALAIELAASRVATYGIAGTSELLDDRFRHSFRGRRTAPARQQTLNATLDWSYNLLDPFEQRALRRLSVFVGVFSIDAALAVASHEEGDSGEIFGNLSNLAGKSLLSVVSTENRVSYRLLDTMRFYLREKLRDAGELEMAAARHARYLRDRIANNQGLSTASDLVREFGTESSLIGNIQTALMWALEDRGDIALGTELAAFAAPLLLECSQLAECQRWSERALQGLSEPNMGTVQEMHLRTALGQSMMFIKGNVEEVRLALMRALQIANGTGEQHHKLRLLGTLQLFHERIGDFITAHRYAVESEEVANLLGEPEAITATHALLGISNHLLGNLVLAKAHLVAALSSSPSRTKVLPVGFGFDHRNRASIALARTLWLQGYPDQAVALSHDTVQAASALRHPVTLCFALIWAIAISFWTGRLDEAEDQIERLSAHAKKHSLAPYIAVGGGASGELAIRRGDAESGIVAIQVCMEALKRTRYESLTTNFNAALVDGMRSIGRHEAAFQLANHAIQRNERMGDRYYLPELLRLRGAALADLASARSREAEDDWQESLLIAHEQGAQSWALRTAATMAEHLIACGDVADAAHLLEPLIGSFSEGLATQDLLLAKRLLRPSAAA